MGTTHVWMDGTPRAIGMPGCECAWPAPHQHPGCVTSRQCRHRRPQTPASITTRVFSFWVRNLTGSPQQRARCGLGWLLSGETLSSPFPSSGSPACPGSGLPPRLQSRPHRRPFSHGITLPGPPAAPSDFTGPCADRGPTWVTQENPHLQVGRRSALAPLCHGA